MIFARNQIATLEGLGVVGRTFFLLSRTSLRALFAEALRFRRELDSFKPDIIHAHYGTVTALFCALLTQVPLVITYQGSDLNPFSDKNPLRPPLGRMMSHLAALRASGIICVSTQLKEKLWWKRGRLEVIPSGVDATVFYPRPKHEARALCNWRNEDMIVISSAGTDPIRKQFSLAEAAVRAAQACCGKIRHVTLNGNCDQKTVAAMFNASDCFLLTSSTEGSPNVIKEALACNLPVVSVDVGDVGERLQNVYPSAIVADNPHQLGAALAEVLRKPVRSNGSDTIVDLTAERAGEKVLALYRDIAEAKCVRSWTALKL
jgi:glycosyltransferase involved in cell wall biosynthesis